MIRVLEVEADLPISVDEARAALRITNELENDVLARKLKAAVRHFESRTGRLLRRHSLEVTFEDWPVYGAEACFEELRLPAYPVREVVAVEYRNDAGGWVEIAADSWSWRRTDRGGSVYFPSSYTLPTLTSEHPERLRITFEAGYDTGAETGTGVDPDLEAPADALEGVLLLAGHWFEHREAVTEGDVAEVPLALRMILEDFRIFS